MCETVLLPLTRGPTTSLVLIAPRCRNPSNPVPSLATGLEVERCSLAGTARSRQERHEDVSSPSDATSLRARPGLPRSRRDQREHGRRAGFVTHLRSVPLSLGH
jgi:hypothetical protein